MSALSGLTAAVESTRVGNPILNISIFGGFVAVTLIVVLRVSRNNKTAADYYAAGRSFTGPQNGTAIAVGYLSAASFLGICGAIAITGYDGFLIFNRIPRRVAYRITVRGRAHAHCGKIHHGRRTVVPAHTAPGAPRSGDGESCGLLLLPAHPDGRRWRSGLSAAGDQ